MASKCHIYMAYGMPYIYDREMPYTYIVIMSYTKILYEYIRKLWIPGGSEGISKNGRRCREIGDEGY